MSVTSENRFSTEDRVIGARIGHLRVTGVLGSGGMGEVYRAFDERLNRTVALKMIRADRRMSVDARGRFLREARTLSSLDHPNICRIHEYIEAEEGDFLVLELVDGLTLQMAIELGMSRQRKLRIAREICDALAAAHRKGIVHRDLKEENVMIAADGRAKVLDFGIARRNEEEETLPPPAPDDDPIETAATIIFRVGGPNATPDIVPRPVTEQGIAVGTPAMMSPEQAVGRVATAASDMYSFGLLLQVLFTEKPVHPEDLGSRELMLRASQGISEPVTGLPRDITALIDRLKQRAPADRPTANEALRVLDRIIAAPKRRARIAAMVILGIALAALVTKYVVDVTDARREAESNRRRAEELVAFMVTDLPSKLEAVGRLDVLDGAASRALAYFKSLDPEKHSGSDLHKNALALARLGEVRVNEGKLDEAVKLFGESVRFAQAAVSRDAKNSEWKLALSNAHFWLGDSLRRKGDRAGTLRHFRRYLEISNELADAHPGDAKYEAEVSYGHGNVGAAYEAMGDIDGALGEYRIAVELDRRRLLREPQSVQWREDLATSLNKVGVVLQTIGQLAAARSALAEELVLRRQLAAAAPGDARRMRELAACLAFSGGLHQVMGEKENAVAAFAEELRLSSELAKRDPENLSARRNRAAAQSRLAMLFANDPPRALAMLDEARRELRQIVKTDARPAWERDLAATLQREGTLHLRAGERHRAQESAREAVAIAERLAAKEPGNSQTMRVLCNVLLFAADAAPDGSEEAMRYRSRVAELPIMSDARDPRLLAFRVRALTGLGRRSEAAPLIATLDRVGYRDLEPVARQ